MFNFKPINRKVYLFIWILYIAIYILEWVKVVNISNKPSVFYMGIAIRIIVSVGVIGYITKSKIAYRIIWEIIFLIISLLLFYIFLMTVRFNMIVIITFLLFLPALYALYSYAYRSSDIWGTEK